MDKHEQKDLVKKIIRFICELQQSAVMFTRIETLLMTGVARGAS